MKIILEKATKQLAQNLPFVLYKKPNDTNVIGFFQKNDSLFLVQDFTEKGFVFTSFDGNQNIIIPENQSEVGRVVYDKNKTDYPEKKSELPNESDRNNFKSLVAKGIKAIENNEFKKVVLSRKEMVNLVHFDLIEAFEKLVHLYSSTFVYCFFHPKVGAWIGATPEQLIKANNTSFQTIALAGTQKDRGSSEVFWEEKEKMEQQFVTDYILETLKGTAAEVVVSEPYNLKAGSIWHIKTDISGVLNSGYGLQQVIRLLHPTPAVCGLPKDKAKAFILENENYNRTFYTGFLGELNMENKTDLFVNLRCMEIELTKSRNSSEPVITKANLYMGCGITKDSIPEREWQESVNKSVTMKKVLDLQIEIMTKPETKMI